MAIFDFLTKDTNKSPASGGIFGVHSKKPKYDLPGINRPFTDKEAEEYNPEVVSKAVSSLPKKVDFFKDINEGVTNFTNKIFKPGTPPEVMKAVNALPDTFNSKVPKNTSDFVVPSNKEMSKAALQAIESIAPGIRPLFHGIFTGDWEAYNKQSKEWNQEHFGSVEGLINTTIGFIDPVGGKLPKRLNPGEVPEQFFKYMAKAKDPESIAKTLVNAGVKETDAISLASQIAPTKTPQEVKDILLNYGKTGPMAEVPPTLEGNVTEPVTPPTPTPKDLENIANQVRTQGEMMSKEKAVTSITPELQPLADEAKKYKSAEEFVSKIRGSSTQYGDYTPNLRHFGMEDYKNISELGVNPDEIITIYRGIDRTVGKVKKQINDGDFVTTDYDSALSYTGDPKDVVSMKVPAKTLYTDAIRDFKEEPFYTGSEYVYTKQKISPLSKSQLIDVYNKATGKESLQLEEPEPEKPISKPVTPKTNEEVTKKIHALREELEEAQNNLDKAVADQDIFGDRIPEFKSRVDDLRKQIKDIKYPPVISKSPREILRQAEEYAGVEPTQITDAEQEVINEEYTKLLETEDKNIAEEVKAIRESRLKKDEQQNEIDQLKLQAELKKEMLNFAPGKKLQKFMSRKEGEFMDLRDPNKAKTDKEKRAIIERNTKVLKASEAAFEAVGRGSDAFDDEDTIRNAIAEYRQRRKEFLETKDLISQKVKNYREKKSIIEAVEKQIRAEGRDRMHQVQLIKDFFTLTDAEMKKVMKGNPDLRLLSEEKFQDLMKGIQGKAYAVAKHREALLAVEATIFDKELRKVENLRQALKMKEFKNMSVNELDKFNELLETFQTGDEFLGPRQIQTAKLTDLGEIKTRREALEALAKEAGVPIEDVQKVQVKMIDKFLYDVAFARQNPLYKIMVENTNSATVESGKRFYEIKNETEKLMKAARKSRPRGLADRLVPTDQTIFDYLSSDDLTKIEFAKRMTSEEIKAALYIQNQYSIMRDYLVNQGTLEKYRQNYITHIRRSFLEMLKETGKGVFTKEGLKGIFKELMDMNKLQRANFNILNDKTGEVLALEKFFKFSMQRSGNLIPTKNVAKAFLNYVSTFETKRELDSFIPKIDIFAHVLTPAETTKRGLIKNDTLRVFVRKWLNTKKGRIVDTGFVSPGDKIDLALRAGVAATRLIDLGLNIPVGLASNLGAQSSTFVPLGVRKYATGVKRSLTKEGKAIARKYEFLVGEPLWQRLSDASKDIGDKTNEIIFGLFSDADRRAKKVFLLGKMTPAEFKSGELSIDRLTELRNEMGRYHVVQGMGSIIGKTAPGTVYTQYKSWAVPMMHTTFSNIAKATADLKSGKNPFKSQEGKELIRSIMITSMILLLGYKAYKELKDKKDRSFLEQLAYKSMNDALSIIGSLNPIIWLSTPRLLKFLGDLSSSLTNVATSLALNERTATGEIPGLNTLESTIEPKAFQQLLGEKTKSTEETVVESLEKSLMTAQGKLDKVDPDVYDRVEKIHEQAMALGFGTPEADELVSEDNMTDDDYEVYKLFRALDSKQAQIELVPKVLPIFEQASELGFGTEEADLLVEDLTDDEYDLYKSMKKILFAKPEVGPSKWDQQSFVEHVSNIAKGWAISPGVAFDNLVHGDWKITQLKNGQIIVDRMPLDASQEVKAKAAKDNADFKLDHIIPLQAGGTNRTNNLQIITTEEWADNTAIENYLGKALADKKITGAEAREYAIRYKAGQEQVLTPDLMEEYINKYNSLPLTFDEIKSEIGNK